MIHQTPGGAIRGALAALAVAAVLAACSSGATAAPSAPTAAPSAAAPSASAPSAAPSAGASAQSSGSPAAGSAVTIQGFAFNPATLTVAVGTTVTWTNQDNVGHTVTADDNSFGSGTLSNGATFSQTFSKAGTYAYHCSIHHSMTGTIVVH